MKKILSIIGVVICLGIFLFAANRLIGIAMDYYHSDKELAAIQEKFYDTVSAEGSEADVVEDESNSIRPKFQSLFNQNNDLVGWIRIKDTKIDYPILQTTNNEDYLKQDFHKEHSILGSIFMDYRDDIITPNRNTIVYGHRTKSGSMFEQLTKYKDQEFLANHPTFQFDTLFDSYEAKVFSVYMTTVDFNYLQTDFINDEEFEQYLTNVREQSMYDLDVKASKDDLILTLSTCDYEPDPHDGRLVVQAVLMKKE